MLDNKLDYLELIQLSRVNHFKQLEIECLYRLNQPIEALEKEMKLHSSINVDEIVNLDNDQDISLGKDIDKTLLRFQEILFTLEDDLKRQLFRMQF